MLDREVYFPLAGYGGPGFHTWPPGHNPQDTAPNPLFRIRPPAKKTFGAAFGAATGVSDPRLQKIRIRNNGAGGDAATVAGYDGPGFHTWPSGHIPQDTAPKPLLRIRSPTKKTFRGPWLCGVPSEREFVFPGGFPGFAPWAGMRCPVGAWDRERGLGIGSNGAAPTRRDAMPRRGHGIGIGIAVGDRPQWSPTNPMERDARCRLGA